MALVMCALMPVVALAQPASAESDSSAHLFMVVQGDTIYLASPLEVIGSRVPVALPGVVRTMDVLMTDELERSAARSVGEALQTVPGVTVSQRQQYGVQSDITMRGSTFDQVQVLLNGYDAGDPQTGHHAMDLPIGKRDVSRLEILPGHGSSLYGPGAFGGTVNVVTRRPAEQNGGRLAVTGGDNGIWGVEAEGDVRLGESTGSRFSLERFRTDGHDVDQPDGSRAWGGNDADTWSGTGRVIHEGDGSEWDTFGAYSEREYGALAFYAPFPSFEKTKTLFLSSLYRTDLSDNVTIEPRVFYRRHRDEFILFRDNPDAYTNDHLTQKTGGELNGVVGLGSAHALAISLEGVYEDVDSRGLRGGAWGDALGSHVRRRASAAAELKRNQGPLRWQAAGRYDYQTIYHGRFSGSGALAYEASEQWTLRTSAGSVYRVPTFTDLYYRDPANVGNPNLIPESGWTWDASAEFGNGPWHSQAAYYERYEDDLIEWARPTGTSLWRVLNIGEGTTRGFEWSGSWRHGAGHQLSLGWSRIDKETDLPADFEGKYLLLVPKNAITVQAVAALDRNLHWTLTGRYLEHNDGPEDFVKYFILDSRVSWQGDSGWSVGLAGTNLTDRRYEEVPGVEMPGTVFTATLGRDF